MITFITTVMFLFLPYMEDVKHISTMSPNLFWIYSIYPNHFFINKQSELSLLAALIVYIIIDER